MNADSDNDEWQAIEDEDDDSVVESPFHQLHPVDEGEDDYEESHKENISDEACDDDDRSSPHIGGVDDSQASTLFQPVQETWNESDRLYHGTQDDSCTSFDIGATMPGM
ncbi:hypothetical protein MLD38_025004 [Melastoma candidum]|uniref:Uncharacterized protein n=1 Tax=Melastoma candidum TaxID=119954 RepID=A0ACB9NTR5_9MYRT|nr:hypothetical protein MLD38_025004 [Melastoma candidum]